MYEYEFKIMENYLKINAIKQKSKKTIKYYHKYDRK